jgi:hypothetical protein
VERGLSLVEIMDALEEEEWHIQKKVDKLILLLFNLLWMRVMK